MGSIIWGFIMKIGIIIYSQTEHTYSVAQKIKEKLVESGNETNLERVITAGDAPPGAKNIEFKTRPDVSMYDALIFGAPVHAFSLAPAMKAYLEQITPLQNKKVACFVTKGLPFHRTGGNQAINQIKKICESKGGIIFGTGIIVWRGGREKKIIDLAESFNKLFN